MKMAAAIAIAIASLAIVAFGVWGSMRLRELWLDQCIITDISRQVVVKTGQHVKAGVILDGLGLRNGENLALVDFKEKRQALLQRIPNIRALNISRHLPDRVEITVIERNPVARLGIKGSRTPTGRVVDSEGVVFSRRVGTGMLPTIREAHAPGTQAGKMLSSRARAALELLMLSSREEFSGLGILEIDISHPDYLLATLGNYQRAKIAWEGMDDLNATSRAKMASQYFYLRKTVLSNVTQRAVMWNATMEGRVTADTKEPIQ